MEKQYSIRPYQRFWNTTGQPYTFLLPALIVFVFVVLSPVIMSLILSFYKFTGFDANIFKEFTGFDNFRILFKDRYFWISFKNTFYFVAASITVQIALSLILAITIFFGRFKNSVLIRTVIFFPAVLAPVSISLAWRRILEQDGLLNQILRIDFSWLASPALAIWVVIFVSIWQWTGYNLVIFYAGLQTVDRTILEAADVDGASWWGKITKIVIPTLTPTIILNIILNLIGSFRVFDIVYVLTRGGPVHQSEVFTTIMYYYSFSANGPNKMGVGSSIAFIMFAIMIVFGFIRIRLMRRGEI
ncbi:MAG: sugar ABC transporter permease [Actinobacteria bacterium]|nr:sugar ABC transporter permease [Actinomycetota bacterium]